MEQEEGVDKSTVRLFWQASLREKRLLLLTFLFPIGNVFLFMLTPLFIGKILAELALPDGNPGRYIPYFVGMALAGIICNRIGSQSSLELQAKTMSYLQWLGLQTLLRRSVGFHNNNVGGKLVSDVIDFPTAYSQLANATVINLVPLAAMLLIGSVVIYIESWMLGLFVTAMTVYAMGSGTYDTMVRKPIRKRRLKATKAVTSHLADAIVNVQTIKTFAHEKEELKRHEELNGTLRDMRIRDWTWAARSGNTRIAVLLAFQLALVLLLVRLVGEDPSLLGIGIFAFSFTITLSLRLFEVNAMLRQIEEGLLMASPLTTIIEETPEIRDVPEAKPLRVKKGEIICKDVTFNYQDNTSGQAVFSNLNLTVKAGEKIGLVGPSGGGKSTLTRLLLRFEDINAGSITIDGQDISKSTQASLREAVAYVPQEPLLFHRPIKENIAYGKQDASQEAIEHAAKLAHAAEFITTLPQSYDTIVGERGVKLSGGQRQRVAISRAILKGSPILVLDEATSALDSESEVLIQQALWELMRGRTAIVIAHRLSTIQKMDRIIVLDEGRIVEEGTHTQLLNRKGTYAKLWAHQSGGFLEE
ncbi:MAG TPA: ABC transporter ATP-binding protein [Candidatus Saccharimonadales bacterium]|nr:ABC transporter ATP-binding protein [Candidatus Saccharimonadales bacterium]